MLEENHAHLESPSFETLIDGANPCSELTVQNLNNDECENLWGIKKAKCDYDNHVECEEINLEQMIINRELF